MQVYLRRWLGGGGGGGFYWWPVRQRGCLKFVFIFH